MKVLFLIFVSVFALVQQDCPDTASPAAADTTPVATPTPKPTKTLLYTPDGEFVMEIRHHDGRVEYNEPEVSDEKN